MRIKLILSILGTIRTVAPYIYRLIVRKKRSLSVMDKNQEYGIQETLEALDFVIPFANKLDEATQDGLQVMDGIILVPTLPKLPKAIMGGDLIPKEIGDLNDMERQQIRDKVAELDFADDQAEEIGEKALAAVGALGELWTSIRKAKGRE